MLFFFLHAFANPFVNRGLYSLLFLICTFFIEQRVLYTSVKLLTKSFYTVLILSGCIIKSRLQLASAELNDSTQCLFLHLTYLNLSF